jgi:hypothetical protein
VEVCGVGDNDGSDKSCHREVTFVFSLTLTVSNRNADENSNDDINTRHAI